jgi:hypothetical protein
MARLNGIDEGCSPSCQDCHENSEFSHQKSNTYEQLAIFMLRGAPKAHAACCKIAIILIDRGLSDNADFSNCSGMGRGSWSPNYGA